MLVRGATYGQLGINCQRQSRDDFWRLARHGVPNKVPFWFTTVGDSFRAISLG